MRTATLTAMLLLGLGCGSAMPRESTTPTRDASVSRVALLPSSWATDSLVDARRVDAAFLEALESQGTLDVVRSSESEECEEDLVCLRRWGLAQDAASVAHVRLAGLGSTVVVRARLIDVRANTRERTEQEVVQDANALRIEEAVTRLGVAFAPEAPARLYEAWWLWTLVGAVAIAGVSSYFLLRPTDSPPDFVITPP